ncbi:MAG: cyclase family protein [Phycisphaera sp.]|nr:MAG: cyclase family protein [Phycisphaera sp.]
MLVDISPPLSPATAVFPGDTALSRTVLMDTARGDHLTLSTLTSTVHVGSHADAESHYKPGGRPIDQHPIELYLGPCVVAPVRAEPGKRFGVDAIDEKWLEAVAGLTDHGQPGRLLLATGTGGNPKIFPSDLSAPEPGCIDALVARGVRLLGVDTPSVDLADAKELVGHAACARGGVSIIEGLVLDDVEPGIWELIALPLRLVGFDASPVRAVLRR